MAIECCSILLRASFLAVALPLLLGGSLFSEVALQLQLQSVKHLKYAAGEQVASAGLAASAQTSAAAAVETETEALELQAQAALLEGLSVEEEKAVVEQRAGEAGMWNLGEEQVGMTEGAQELQVAVNAAAGSAAEPVVHAEAAAQAATAMAAGDVGSVEASVASAQEAADATAAATNTAEVVEGGELGGPLGLTVAAAGVAAVAEAPKAVAAAQAVSTNFQADHDEVLVVEKEAQVGALEADALIDTDGAAFSQSAVTKNVAIAGAYFTSAQLFQILAFAFEAPVALVVVAQWIFGVGATVCGTKKIDGAFSCGSIAGSLSLGAALASLLIRPWTETVLYAADLGHQDPDLKLLSSLPSLIQNATKNRKGSGPAKGHRARSQKETANREAGSGKKSQSRKLEGGLGGWLAEAGDVAHGLEKGAQQEASQLGNATSGIVHNAGNIKIGGKTLQQEASQLNNETSQIVHRAENATVGAVAGVRKAGGSAVGALAGAVTKNVQQGSTQVGAAAGVVSKDVQQGLSQASGPTAQAVHNVAKVGGSAVGALAGRISDAVPKDVKQQASGVVNISVNLGNMVRVVGGKAANEAMSAMSKAVPKNVKSAANVAAQDTARIAGEAAQRAQQAAIRLKNGNPDVHTTTVKLRQPPKTAAVKTAWSQFKPALTSVKKHVIHWCWRVLQSVLLISGVIALAELCLASGRHLPAYLNGSVGRPVLAGRVLRDTYHQWMMGVALLIAAWVLSILFAAGLQSSAQQVQDHLDSGGLPLRTVQLALCMICFLVCCVHAVSMGRSDYISEPCAPEVESGSREEQRPITSEEESDVELQKKESDVSLLKGATDVKSAPSSLPMLCMVITAILDAILLSVERPIMTWATGSTYKSYFAFRFIVGLLPWSMVAPSLWGYTPSSPTMLLLPVALVSFLIGGMLVVAKQKGR